MKMADMKMSKRTKEMDMPPSPMNYEGDRWPYGLQLRFESEQIEELPHLKNMKIGQKVMVQGAGEITSIRMNERKGGKEDYSIEVQLHEVGCESKKEEEPMSMVTAMREVKEERKMW